MSLPASSTSVLLPGLVSVTFRQLSPSAIVELCVRHGLRGIEWGGDIHCPPGEVKRALTVAALTVEAGLEVAAYGSYYRAGVSDPAEFSRVLEVAAVLKAPWIRVWAGNRGSEKADPDYRARVTDDVRRVAAEAKDHGVRISLEYHAQTLTDEIQSALALLQDVPGIWVQWQPANGHPPERAAVTLTALVGRISNLHVLAWGKEQDRLVRLPLAAHRDRWRHYFSIARQSAGRRFALLEFVRGDRPEQLAEDARTLHALLADQR